MKKIITILTLIFTISQINAQTILFKYESKVEYKNKHKELHLESGEIQISTEGVVFNGEFLEIKNIEFPESSRFFVERIVTDSCSIDVLRLTEGETILKLVLRKDNNVTFFFTSEAEGKNFK